MENNMTEENKIIAEFMGYKFFDNVIGFDDYGERATYQETNDKQVWVLNPTKEFDEHKRIYRSYYEDKDLSVPFDDYVYSLQYTSSWDWIHPAFRKMTEIGAWMIANGHDRLWVEKSQEMNHAMLFEDTPKKAATLIALMIKWYKHTTRQ